ncbi:MAG: rhomboid family intramembrane serine protease [Bacteroidales bacterium]|jgi:membrane associated rhomboid family serine protease|nr:rhomboid family intramembrane serine protease [Bacteroidales bacterium]
MLSNSNLPTIEKKRITHSAVIPLLFVGILWVIRLLQDGMSWDLSFFGIYPHKMTSLQGIVLHYLVHADIEHLWSNTLVVFISGWFLFYFYSTIVWRTLGCLWLLTGVFLWSIGRSGVHVGASGLAYGIVFFLIFSGIIRQHTPLIAVSLVVVFLYGSLTWGMFPFSELIKPDMSWEGHLSGGLAGLITALMLQKQGPQKPQQLPEDEDSD